MSTPVASATPYHEQKETLVGFHPSKPATPHTLPVHSDQWWEVRTRTASEALTQHSLIASAVLSSSIFLLGLVLSSTLTLLPISDPSINSSQLMATLLLLFASVFAGLFMLTVVYVPTYWFWKWDASAAARGTAAAATADAAAGG